MSPNWSNPLSIFYPLQLGADNPFLRKVSEPVEKFDPSIAEFAENLLELMREYEGVWLAAPQIGQNIRIIATTQWKKMPTSDTMEQDFISETILINPQIIWKSERFQSSQEGCLSLPGLQGRVQRYVAVEVEYYTPQGQKKKKKFSGYNAAIVQHEIDHLDGILFTDKVIEGSLKEF